MDIEMDVISAASFFDKQIEIIAKRRNAKYKMLTSYVIPDHPDYPGSGPQIVYVWEK